MNDYTYSSEVFFNELLRISTGFIWKNPVLATKNESADQVVYVEQYILARQNRLTFHIVDQLITNFHQPKSTLLLLVSAFVGGDWHTIYDYALAHDFRFLSYGDSSILFRRNQQ